MFSNGFYSFTGLVASVIALNATELVQTFGIGLEPSHPQGIHRGQIHGTLSGNGETTVFSYTTNNPLYGKNAIYTEGGGLIECDGEFGAPRWADASLSFDGQRFVSLNTSPFIENPGLEVYEVRATGGAELIDWIPQQEFPGDFGDVFAPEFAISGRDASPFALVDVVFDEANGDLLVYNGDSFEAVGSLKDEFDTSLTSYRLYEGGGEENTIYFTKGTVTDPNAPQAPEVVFAYDGETLTESSIDRSGLSHSGYLSDFPISPNGRFVLFEIVDLSVPHIFSLALYDQQSESFTEFIPGSLGDSLPFYLDFRPSSNGMVFATTYVATENTNFGQTISVVFAPDGQVQTLSDYIRDRLPTIGEGITADTLDAIEIYEVLDFSDDGLRLLVTGQDTDGGYDAFLIDLLTGSFLSARQLGLIQNEDLVAMIESGSTSKELIGLFRGGRDAQIAEFGRGLSSILPAASSSVMSNALNHTFNLNSRFDMLHRESFARQQRGRDKNGWSGYAYSTAVIRDYESNVSDVRGDIESYGGMLVVDYKFSDSLYVGTGLGLKTDEGDFNSGGELNSDTYSASLYASSRFIDHLYLDALIQYADVEMESERQSLDVLRAKPEATAYGSEIRASYYFEKEGFTVAPKLSISYNYLDFDAYSETGGLSAASVENFSVESLRASLGVQAQHWFTFLERPLIGNLQLDWNHEFFDEGETIYASIEGTSFKTETDDPDSDSGLISIGFNYLLTDQIDLYGEYSKNFGESLNDDHVIRLGVSCLF